MIRHCYYLTRPLTAGAYLKTGLIKIDDFGGKTLAPGMDVEAYARLTYDRVLPDSDLSDFGLVPDWFERMYALSWYTITGCGGDLNDWKNGYEKLLHDAGIGAVMEWHHFTGKEMNDHYGLTGDNRYPDNLHFLAFSLDGLNVGKLAMVKLRMGDRWFDDIVDNNDRRESDD